MKFVCETNNFEEYLKESETVDITHSIIQSTASQLFSPSQSDVEKAEVAFRFVRDEISHSWDIQGTKVTAKASDTLYHKQGICYAKSMVLAALLRTQDIPTGFCYQRLMLFDTPEKGYSLHALNAVYLPSLKKWVRLDARGNKEGVNAQFSINQEKLAFEVNEKMDEKDYPTIFIQPHPKTITVLNDHTDAINMYLNHLPESI